MVLTEMGGAFSDFVAGMRTAHATNAKAAVVHVYGEAVSYLFRPYTEKSRLMLAAKLRAHLAGSCTVGERAAFASIMEKHGLAQLYMPTTTTSPTQPAASL
jgi:hypothetical protein